MKTTQWLLLFHVYPVKMKEDNTSLSNTLSPDGIRESKLMSPKITMKLFRDIQELIIEDGMLIATDRDSLSL